MFFKKKKISEEKQQVKSLYSAHVSSGKTDFFTNNDIDFVMGFREGPWLFDIDGKKRLFDLHANGGVFNLEHRNKEVIKVLKHELSFYDMGNPLLMSKPRAELAKKIADLMPGDLSYSIFGVGGGESVDLAFKIARSHTQRKKIIVVEGGSQGAGFSAQTGDDLNKNSFSLASPDLLQIPFNDINALSITLSDEVAAVIVETIPADLGIVVPKTDYLTRIKNLCEENGSLLILDEIRNGSGRTGKLWAFEHYNVIPDMVILANGLSGGIYPISVTVISKRLEGVFHDDPLMHVSAYGGSELGCQVALKVLEISSDKQFLDNVNKLSGRFRFELEVLREKHSGFFKGVRRKGLMIGLEFVDEKAGPIMTKAAFDKDLLLIYAGNDTSVVQFFPPLIIDENDIGFIIKRLDKTIKKAKLIHTALKIKNNISDFLDSFQ